MGELGKSRKRGGTYTPEEIERGLVALALAAGNRRRAARLLKEHGQPIPEGTLGRWKTEHAERYETVRQDVLPRLKATLAEDYADLAQTQMEVQRKLLARLDAETDNLDVRDVSTAVRNVAVSGGISTDKGRDLRGDPSVVIRQQADPIDILRKIQTRFPGVLQLMPDTEAAIETEVEEEPTNGDTQA